MNMKKLFVTLGVIVVVANVLIVMPKLIKYNGMILTDIGEYRGDKYAYGGGSSYGLYRKKASESKYVNIAEYAPLKDKFVFFQDDEIIYSTRAYSIVQLNLNTLKSKVYESDAMSFVVIAVNKNYIVAEDVDNDSALTILDINTFEIVDVVEINPKNPEVTELLFKFTDSKTNKIYKYNFESRELIKVSE